MTFSGELITGLTSLVIGCIAGLVMHRSDFCMAGMMRDLFLFRRYTMLKVLALLVLANMILTEVFRLYGWIALFPYPAFGPPALSNLLGGALFGFGMVLAGGCVAGTLYKMGSGNVISMFAFVGLLIGSTLYAEFHGAWKAFSDATVFAPGKITLPQLLGVSQGATVSAAIVILGIPVLYWWKTGAFVRRSYAAGYLQPWKAALIIAVLVTISVITIGVPLGITTSYSKFGSWFLSLILPEHVRDLAYFSAKPFSYANQLLGIAYSGGPGPGYDGIALIQYPLIFGLVAGGLISSASLGEFRIYLKVPLPQLASGLLGGVLMGLAARMAPSCNIWHLLGGLPILVMQSMLFGIGLLPGAWLGGKFLSGIVLKNN